MSRRLRLTLLIVVAAIVALAAAALIALYVLMQPQRVTEMLRAQARQAGMQLTLSTPAEPTLWPQPALVLHGLTLSMDNRPVLVAARGRLVLPWRTLLGGPPAITRLELDTPQINLAQLGPVLANMHPGPQDASPALLAINTGVRITRGSLVRGGKTLLDHIRLRTGPLASGHAFRLRLDADTAQGAPFHLRLDMVPRKSNGALILNDIQLDAGVKPLIQTRLHGQAQWQADGSMHLLLSGQLVHRQQHHYAITVRLGPDAAATGSAATNPIRFALTITGQGVNADLAMSPAELADWWQQLNGTTHQGGLPLPPVQGVLQASKLDLGDVHIEGLSIVTSNGPANTASTTAPATAASINP